MKEVRYNLRLSKQENDALRIRAKQNGVSIIRYIKQKLFAEHENSANEDITYELPSKEKHEYFNTWVLHTVYMLLLNMLCENKTADEALKIKENCKDHAKQNIAKQGYIKFDKEDKSKD